ncbi:MAG: 50S ribosomal protein L19 [Candidatus Yanofskybacteria bacterium]|nr:50S ribosomal protein L19 [Candidatus Yanofskybacteria bacterium]
MNILHHFNSTLSTNKTLPDIRSGQTVKVYQKIKEGAKTRTQIFEGIVIAQKHGSGSSATITVRKISNGVGVERIFPLHSPAVEKFEIIKTAKVRRAKLYYLRHKTARETRKKTKLIEPKVSGSKSQNKTRETSSIQES